MTCALAACASWTSRRPRPPAPPPRLLPAPPGLRIVSPVPSAWLACSSLELGGVVLGPLMEGAARHAGDVLHGRGDGFRLIDESRPGIEGSIGEGGVTGSGD